MGQEVTAIDDSDHVGYLASMVLGVSVYAGTSYHNPIYRFNFGDYVRADPSGTFTQGVGRP